MAQTHDRETMSALLATHTAIRVARDVGYPPIDVPLQPEPAIPLEVPTEYSAQRPRITWSTVLLEVLMGITITIGIAVLCWAVYMCLKYPPPLE